MKERQMCWMDWMKRSVGGWTQSRMGRIQRYIPQNPQFRGMKGNQGAASG
ncbi:MAG: hypothetical protein ACLTER_20780 [Ruminococcus sp.]